MVDVRQLLRVSKNEIMDVLSQQCEFLPKSNPGMQTNMGAHSLFSNYYMDTEKLV